MSKRPAIDTQKSRRNAERDSIGAQLYGSCRAHGLWDCDEGCVDRSGANEIEPGESAPIARYCAGFGCGVLIIRDIAEFDAVTKRQRRN